MSSTLVRRPALGLPSRAYRARPNVWHMPRDNILSAKSRVEAAVRARRNIQSAGAFQPLRPPSPSELGAPRAAKQYKRGRRWTRWLTIAVVGGSVIYVADRQIYASGFLRTLRTFGTTLVVALDYKINFRPEPLTAGSVPELHTRSAERLFDLLRANGGLYLKIGQAIAMQSAVLPPEFQKMFGRMFDDAPQDDWKDVEAVIRRDFGGRSVEDVFGVSFTGKEGMGVMERKARASASVAQVHWARLADGREVAIKVQKREIAKQIAWDLWAFRTVTWLYSKWFDLPLYTLVPFITERLELETDFINEAKNSDTMRELVKSEKRLKGRVYIPIVHSDLSTKRVLTTEWIEGVRLWDKKAMTSRWLGGNGKGSPGASAPLPEVNMDAARHELRTHPYREKIKPERQEWKGARRRGGLGLSTKEVMTTMVDLFSAQIFKWGVVHCDPHPGNIFVRRKANGRSEIVLIDHGLYVYMRPEFRRQYGTFWKALMTFDNATISRVSEEWGIKAKDFFASATLMRPYESSADEDESGEAGMSLRAKLKKELDDKSSSKTSAERHYAMQQLMKQSLRDMLADEDKWPKELIFIGRNMRIVQGNNQYLGSPVNRVKMMGEWASRSLFEDKNLPWSLRLHNAWRHVIFKAVLSATDIAFYFFKFRQWLGIGGGMEDEMEQQMKNVASDYGIELQHEVFDG